MKQFIFTIISSMNCKGKLLVMAKSKEEAINYVNDITSWSKEDGSQLSFQVTDPNNLVATTFNLAVEQKQRAIEMDIAAMELSNHLEQ
jgi:hypothetical protein